MGCPNTSFPHLPQDFVSKGIVSHLRDHLAASSQFGNRTANIHGSAA